MTDKLMNPMLEVEAYNVPRHGWNCFHCGDHYPSTEAGIKAAREHFGPTPMWSPLCVDRRTASDDDLVNRTREAELNAADFLRQRDEAIEEAEIAESQLSSLGDRFKGARSVYDAWSQMDSMTGRALAAEAILREIEKQAPEALAAARLVICGPGEYYPMAPRAEEINE